MPLQRETMLPPALRWIESWLDEPTVFLPEVPDLEAAAIVLAPLATAARYELAPADPAEVIVFLKALADRHRLDLPDIHALELDAETLAEIPRVALRDAFKEVWRIWKYRRLPTVGDILSIAARELQEGRAGRLRRLTEAELKLKTAHMRARWDAEACERHARDRAEEHRRTSDVIDRQAEAAPNVALQSPAPGDRERRHREYREAARHVAETLAKRRRILAERERQAADTLENTVHGEHPDAAGLGSKEYRSPPIDTRSIDSGLTTRSTLAANGRLLESNAAVDATPTAAALRLGSPAPATNSMVTWLWRRSSEHIRCWGRSPSWLCRHWQPDQTPVSSTSRAAPHAVGDSNPASKPGGLAGSDSRTPPLRRLRRRPLHVTVHHPCGAALDRSADLCTTRPRPTARSSRLFTLDDNQRRSPRGVLSPIAYRPLSISANVSPGPEDAMPATIRTNCSSSGLELVHFNRLDEAKPTATRRLTTRHRMPSSWRVLVGAEEGSDAVRSDRHRKAPAPAVDTLKRCGFRSWARASPLRWNRREVGIVLFAAVKGCPRLSSPGSEASLLPRSGRHVPDPRHRLYSRGGARLASQAGTAVR
jgi:hypothetical protein